MYPPVVCKTPFGFPVDPDVYRINSGSSAFISSGMHLLEAFEIISWYQISLSSTQLILFPVYMIQVSEFLAPTSTQNPNTIIGLFGLVGFVGVIILIVFWCKPSIKSENKYGDYTEI